jgi:hypothetical protein
VSKEYGRASFDVRRRFTIGGNLTTRYGFRINPFVQYRSGNVFNITTGKDLNGDTLFTDRPSFATGLNEPGVIVTRFGAFDPTPEPGDVIIPRNYGRGPSYFQLNLNLAKEFLLTGGKKDGRNGSEPADDDEDAKGLKLEISVQIRNLFNHTNGGTPIGNLSSSFFGRSVSMASGGISGNNRRISFEVLLRY